MLLRSFLELQALRLWQEEFESHCLSAKSTFGLKGRGEEQRSEVSIEIFFLKHKTSSLLEDILHNSLIVSNSAFPNPCQRSLYATLCHPLSASVSGSICIHQCRASREERYCMCVCLTQKPVILLSLATLPTEQLTHLFKNVSIRISEIVTGILKTFRRCQISFNRLRRSISHCFLSGCDC